MELPDATIEEVVLVNEADEPIGRREKLAAHRAGELHRAFSVMVWDRRDRLLLQQRHAGKYHSGGLWTNSCCGHPRPGEDLKAAAQRRLGEEMNIACQLAPLGRLIYRAELDNGLIEHELVHILSGRYEGPVQPDPRECDDFLWEDIAAIEAKAAAAPKTFTVWFRKYLEAGWPLRPPATASPT